MLINGSFADLSSEYVNFGRCNETGVFEKSNVFTCTNEEVRLTGLNLLQLTI